jgi:hypothetical protein
MRLVVSGLVTAVAAWCAMGGLASAAFPNFSDCPTLPPGGGVCLDIQSLSGEFVIKGFHVPLHNSLEIRGGGSNETHLFYPPVGTNGFFAQPVNVPGGVLGLELPISLNLVLATAELAGPSSSIVIEGFDITLPIKVHLSNPLIGSTCYIGSNSNPIRAHLIAGTTEPPPPNRPISGHIGRIEFPESRLLIITGNLNVDNSFAVPGATGCGFLGILNPLIDLKLQLPSAAGNNSLSIENNIGFRQVIG